MHIVIKLMNRALNTIHPVELFSNIDTIINDAAIIAPSRKTAVFISLLLSSNCY